MIIFIDRPLLTDGDSFFALHDAQDYEGTMDEAREEMQFWLNHDFATLERTEENTHEVAVEDMYKAIHTYVFGAGDYGDNGE